MAVTDRGGMLRIIFWPLALALPIIACALIARAFQITPPPNPLMPAAGQIFPLDIVLFVFGWWFYLLYASTIRMLFMRLQSEAVVSFKTQLRLSFAAAFVLMAVAAFLRSLNYLWPVEGLAGKPLLFYGRVLLNVLIFLGAYLLEAEHYIATLKETADVPRGRAAVTWFSPTLVLVLGLFLLRLV